MTLTHDEYYTRKITRDYGENFFPCSGFIACSFSFIMFMITVSVYMSFCLIKEDIKHEKKAKLTSESKKKGDLKENQTHDKLLTKDKKKASSPEIDPKQPHKQI